MDAYNLSLSFYIYIYIYIHKHKLSIRAYYYYYYSLSGIIVHSKRFCCYCYYIFFSFFFVADLRMNVVYLSFLLVFLIDLSRETPIIYLDDCTYSIDLYSEYLNVIWSSNDSRTLHIQAVYSLTSNRSLIPGHIYTYLSQSVALIPFFVQCKSTKDLFQNSYLPFTRCSSTITNVLTKKNYESTRTNLNLKQIFSLTHVPLLYTGEYNLLLSNCSFRFDSKLYQLKSNEIFRFRIEYEKPINENVTSCQTCNQRTSICEFNQCRCRSGTMPIKLSQNKEFCVDTTRNCSLDTQRCLYSDSQIRIKTQSNDFLWILFVIFGLLFIFFVLLLFCLYYHCSSKRVLQKEKTHSSNQSIFMINRHERTPSTISTTDSIKLNDYNHLDQHILANEYVSTFYEDYPKIISDRNNGDLVLILA